MASVVLIFVFAERVMGLMQNHLVIKQATFLSPLAFFALILCFWALPTGEKLEMKGEAYLELSHELPIDREKAPAPAIQTSKKRRTFGFGFRYFAAVLSAIGGAQLNRLGDKIPTALAETAINKTKDLINKKANEMANSVGHGKTKI